MSDDRIRRHVTVNGNVQGVNFRSATERKATEAGVTGWVRNCSDGSVEAVFEGSPDAVDQVIDFCRQGPTAADVNSVDARDEEPEGLRGFSVR